MELVIILPVHQYSIDIFIYSGPSGYWVLTESKILLKLVLEGVRIVVLPLVLTNRLNKNQVSRAAFTYCRLSVFLKDSFFQIIYRS